MQRQLRFWIAVAAALLALEGTAFAHVSVSGPAFAGKSALLTFGIGHGCEGTDTVKLEVTIPKEVTGVRGVPAVFGDVEVKLNDAMEVTSVVWTKTAAARAADDAYYQVQLRATMPDAPFTTLLFPAKQTCRAADGTETVVDWAASAEEIAAVKDGGVAPEPAPALIVLPVRAPGWTKFEAKSAISDLSIFSDAEIVWVGDAAYSSNPATAAACGDDDDAPADKPDSGSESRADSGKPKPDAGTKTSALPRPSLPRPPCKGLPPELRPPR